MMDCREIDQVAAEFETAREQGEYFPRAWADRLSMDDAYRVLLARLRHRKDVGSRRIGWKIGLTAEAIQQQLGFHEPVFACLLAEGLRSSDHVFRHSELINPGFETEL